MTKRDYVIINANPGGSRASRRAQRKRRLPKPGPLGKRNTGMLVGNSIVHGGLVAKAVGCLCPDPDSPETHTLYPDGGGKRVGYVTRNYIPTLSTCEVDSVPGAYGTSACAVISPSLEKTWATAKTMVGSSGGVLAWNPPIGDVNYSSYSGSWDRIRMLCCCLYLEYTGSNVNNQGDVTIFTLGEAFHASAPPVGNATESNVIGLQTLKVPLKDCSGMFVLKPFNPVEARKFEQVVTGEADGWGSVIVRVDGVHIDSSSAPQQVPIRIRVVQFWEATPLPNTVYASMASHSTHQPQLMAAMDDARNNAPSFYPGKPQQAMRAAHEYHHKSILARLKGGISGATSGFATGGPMGAIVGGLKGLLL